MAGQYYNPIPTRFLAPIDYLKIPVQVPIDNSKEEQSGEIVHLPPNRGIVLQNMKGISPESRGSNLTLPPSVNKAKISVLETYDKLSDFHENYVDPKLDPGSDCNLRETCFGHLWDRMPELTIASPFVLQHMYHGQTYAKVDFIPQSETKYLASAYLFKNSEFFVRKTWVWIRDP